MDKSRISRRRFLKNSRTISLSLPFLAISATGARVRALDDRRVTVKGVEEQLVEDAVQVLTRILNAVYEQRTMALRDLCSFPGIAEWLLGQERRWLLPCLSETTKVPIEANSLKRLPCGLTELLLGYGLPALNSPNPVEAVVLGGRSGGLFVFETSAGSPRLLYFHSSEQARLRDSKVYALSEVGNCIRLASQARGLDLNGLVHDAGGAIRIPLLRCSVEANASLHGIDSGLAIKEYLRLLTPLKQELTCDWLGIGLRSELSDEAISALEQLRDWEYKSSADGIVSLASRFRVAGASSGQSGLGSKEKHAHPWLMAHELFPDGTAEVAEVLMSNCKEVYLDGNFLCAWGLVDEAAKKAWVGKESQVLAVRAFF